jgi:hypothetical protein
VRAIVRDPDLPTLASATREALAAEGVERTWQGVACIRLAELIDAHAGRAAENVREHRTAMSVALAEAEHKADVIDLLFAEKS